MHQARYDPVKITSYRSSGNGLLPLRTLVCLIFLFFLVAGTPPGFKEEQMAFPRVRDAYAEKGEWMRQLLRDGGLEAGDLKLYIRIFKQEKELEVWAKKKEEPGYFLLHTIPVCRTSGSPGPKRKQGDRQIPEGFYHIDRFNPASRFHLSLGINYPNVSDRILGDPGRPGGDIFIHGSCVTIGCVPVTNRRIKELYILCVEAVNNGQHNIPVTIFPARMTDPNLEELRKDLPAGRGCAGLWEDLKRAYDRFESGHQLPRIEFLADGRHRIL